MPMFANLLYSLWNYLVFTILSPASAHPPVLWFFEVLRVTAHLAKFCIVNPKVGGPLSLHGCNCFDALWSP